MTKLIALSLEHADIVLTKSEFEMLNLKDKLYSFFSSRRNRILVARVLLMILSALLLYLTIDVIFYGNIEYSKRIYSIVNACVVYLILFLLFLIYLKFKNNEILFLIPFIQLYLSFCIFAYIYYDSIKRLPECYKSLAMFILWFIPFCFLVRRSVRAFLKSSKFLISVLSVLFTLLGFLNESNWTIVALIITCIVFLLKLENLQILCKGIFDIKIEDSDSNKYKLIIINIMTVVFEAMLYLSIKLSEYLSELLNWIYDCVSASGGTKSLNNEIITEHMWLGFYRFIILAVIFIIVCNLFESKQNDISTCIKNIFDCEDNIQVKKNS